MGDLQGEMCSLKHLLRGYGNFDDVTAELGTEGVVEEDGGV